ncbi:MAG: TIGR03790 family protein, partial [Acidobacteriia bacterium]|nr:TIGR03790 family protein [Terriglobia bacterium]
GRMKGARDPRAGGVANPFFMKRDAAFGHPQFPIYLVTRLAAYDLADVKAMIDRSLSARNRGKFVIDAGTGKGDGDNWLRTAAMLLPRERVLMDETPAVLYDRKDVIGYASWGSNDGGRKRRRLGFQWLPGAIATEYVSTNARTLKRPPDNWTFTTWEDRVHFFAGSPQGLSADLIQEGAAGASGNTYEPYLAGCARPDYLLPAYFQGRNLAESYYMALPYLSWQAVVLGDPLCSLGKP